MLNFKLEGLGSYFSTEKETTKEYQGMFKNGLFDGPGVFI